MKTDDGFTGMVVQVWETVARDLSLSYEYQLFSSFRDLLAATQAGEINVAVSNISVTSARAELLDFTPPWFDAGLPIMTIAQPAKPFWMGRSDHAWSLACLRHRYARLCHVVGHERNDGSDAQQPDLELAGSSREGRRLAR